MTDLKSMTPEELTAWCREQGQPAFRGRQLFQWLSRGVVSTCLLYTSPSPRDPKTSRMPSSA